jgi:hypothetical protein
MNSELIVLGPDEIIDSGLPGFNEENLPEIIQGQISKLNDLDMSVKKAMNSATLAKDSAENAKNKSAGFGKKKVAIEELQAAGIDMAEAVQLGAEAQRISFEFQTKLAKITKYLFGLGVSNIASNRYVVRELEMKLKGATKEELSELARQELISVVKQLKEQEDILRKQENFSKALKKFDDRLIAQFKKNQQIDQQFETHSKIEKLHNEQLNIHSETSKRIKEKLHAQAELNARQNKQLHAQSEIIKFHDEQLKIQAETNIKLQDKLEAQEELDMLHDDQLRIYAENGKRLEKQLETQAKIVKGQGEQLAAVQEKNKDLNEQITSHLITIEEQEVKIKRLQNEMATLKILLDSKANNTFSKITLGITILALAVSLSCFFFL